MMQDQIFGEGLNMKPITSTERMVCNIRTAQFKPYVDPDGKEVPGQTFLQWDDTFPEGAGFTIYRMAPGSSSQPHEHTCHEQFYVIEGEIADNDGYIYKTGDFVLLKTGTQHFSTTQHGATLVVFVRELEKNL
jgi:quercetin dioxygenase-like cupin family protein